MEGCVICGSWSCLPSDHTQEEFNSYYRIVEEVKEELMGWLELRASKKGKLTLEQINTIMSDFGFKSTIS